MGEELTRDENGAYWVSLGVLSRCILVKLEGVEGIMNQLEEVGGRCN